MSSTIQIPTGERTSLEQQVLTPAAIEFLQQLHRRFESNSARRCCRRDASVRSTSIVASNLISSKAHARSASVNGASLPFPPTC